MQSQFSSIRGASQQDITEELRCFIAGTTRSAKCNPLDLTKTAISLLKTLPATREAIFEYFCTVFDNTTQNYITRIEVWFDWIHNRFIHAKVRLFFRLK